MEPRGQHSKVQRGPVERGYGGLGDPLESFSELGELVLVGDRDLDSRRRDARAEAGGALAGDAHSFHESGVGLAGGLAPRLSAGAGPAGGPVGGPGGQTPWGDLAGGASSSFVVGLGQHGAGVALRGPAPAEQS